MRTDASIHTFNACKLGLETSLIVFTPLLTRSRRRGEPSACGADTRARARRLADVDSHVSLRRGQLVRDVFCIISFCEVGLLLFECKLMP